MKRSLVVLGLVLAPILAWSIERAKAQGQRDKVAFVSSKNAKFSEVPETNGRVSMAPLWGDANAGAHATFTKFAPG